MRHIQAESSICNSKALRPCLQDLVSVEVLQIHETHAIVGSARHGGTILTRMVIAIAANENNQMASP